MIPTHVPSMLTVAPKGKMKSATDFGTPAFPAHRMVVGSVPIEELLPKATT